MAAKTRRAGQERSSPEDKLLQAIFGRFVSARRLKNPPRDIARDQELFGALDAISDSLAAHVGRWNTELDLIEEGLSRSAATGRHAEATL